MQPAHKLSILHSGETCAVPEFNNDTGDDGRGEPGGLLSTFGAENATPAL